MKYTEYFYITTVLDQIGNSVMTIQQDSHMPG